MSKGTPHQQLPRSWEAREALRDKGQFWTPSWVAEAMVAYVANNTNLIFDPAAGRGAFFEALLNLDKPNISFFGIDIDDNVLLDEIYKDQRCTIEKKDFIKNPPNGAFKSIVANPPYIRHHRIDEKTKALLKQMAVRITGRSIDGRAGLHIYFLIQALSLLELGGKLAFILPADACEGKFAENLWGWVSENFCIECVATFSQDATPFPNVDTNAVVVFIKKSKPLQNIYWVKANQSYSPDLLDFVLSDFKQRKFSTIQIAVRQLSEARTTGFSRPKPDCSKFDFYLNDFAHVMRGIATGSNEFFFLTGQQVKQLNISAKFLKRAIGRTRDAVSDILTPNDIEHLEEKGRPTYLLSIHKNSKLSKSLECYLKIGEQMGLPDRSLIRQRNPWYKMEKRETPSILFAYLGRRNTRFIKNEAGVVPLTGFLCIYPIYDDEKFVNNLWKALNHPDTLENLKMVGKSYGSGAIKVEPSNLSKLPIPNHVVRQFGLQRLEKNKGEQLTLFARNP